MKNRENFNISLNNYEQFKRRLAVAPQTVFWSFKVNWDKEFKLKAREFHLNAGKSEDGKNLQGLLSKQHPLTGAIDADSQKNTRQI